MDEFDGELFIADLLERFASSEGKADVEKSCFILIFQNDLGSEKAPPSEFIHPRTLHGYALCLW